VGRKGRGVTGREESRGLYGFSLAAATSDQSALFACTPTFVLTEIAAPPTGAQFTMETYTLPTRVDLHAAGISGGSNEEPIASYSWYRAGTLLATTAGPDFSDVTIVASTSYSYSMIATTFGAYTLSTVTASVTTPPMPRPCVFNTFTYSNRRVYLEQRQNAGSVAWSLIPHAFTHSNR